MHYSVSKLTQFKSMKCITLNIAISKLTKINHEIWKVRAEFHLRLYEKYECHRDGFHETHTFSKPILKK
jgi:hypothetical protein